MARKPRDYAAEYARRTAGTRAGSLERQRKRGHAPKAPGKTEASERREREQREAVALGKLTTPQRRAIREFSRERAEFAGLDPDDAVAEVMEWATAHGIEAFDRERKYIKRLGMQGSPMAAIEARSADGDGLPDPRMYWYRTKEQMQGRSYTPRRPDQQAARKRREQRAKRKQRSRRRRAA